MDQSRFPFSNCNPPGRGLRSFAAGIPFGHHEPRSVLILRLKRAQMWLHDCSTLADYTHVNSRSDNTRIERRPER